MKHILLFFFLMSFLSSFAQDESKFKLFETRPNKGKFYVSYGWNKSNYSNADIHFKGNNYAFSLSKVKATDRQSPFSFELYFGPETITIPQVNFKVGFFFHNNFNFQFSIDHMKYVMVQNQTTKINGYIENTNSVYDAIYENDDLVLTEDFLTFEHTDGLNYISFEVNRFDNILKWLKLENKFVSVNLQEGLGLGLVTPKTNAKLLQNERNDVFYVSGYGFSANAGINLTAFQYLFFEYNVKAGFMHLPYVKTTNSKSDSAKQSFWFVEYFGNFGVIIKLYK